MKKLLLSLVLILGTLSPLCSARQIIAVLPEGSQTSVTIPDTAISIPPSGLLPGTQAATVQSIKDQQAHQDSMDLGVFIGACANYTLSATRSQELGISKDKWPVKPVQPPAHGVSAFVDNTGVIWLWLDVRGVLGSPCPDVAPPLPLQPPLGTVQIGNHNFGLYWAQGPKDNPPTDIFQGKVFQGTSLDGVSGSWMFLASPMSSEIYGRKGWYLKVN